MTAPPSDSGFKRTLLWLLACSLVPVVNLAAVVLYGLDPSRVETGRGPAPPATAPGARRALAALVDLLLLYGLLLVPWVGWLLALAYGLFRDALLPGGQSPGKRLAGLRVRGGEGGRLSPAESFLRNLTVGVPVVQLLSIPLEAGIIVFTGRRLGDRLAGTAVVPAREEPCQAESRIPS